MAPATVEGLMATKSTAESERFLILFVLIILIEAEQSLSAFEEPKPLRPPLAMTWDHFGP